MDVSLHRTNKHIKNKVVWNYSTNDFQSPFMFMVKICHCCLCTTYWYFGQLAWFDEEYIILWNSLWCSYSCGNIMTQSNVMTETKKYTTPNTSFNWTKNTSVLYNAKSAPMTVWYKITKRSTRSDYVMVSWKKGQIMK